MHASSKAGTVGAGMILLAVGVLYGSGEIVARAVAAIFFLLLTVPVASHMIGRAAYVTGVKLWSGTVVDELRERYEVRKREEADSAERSTNENAADWVRRVLFIRFEAGMD